MKRERIWADILKPGYKEDKKDQEMVNNFLRELNRNEPKSTSVSTHRSGEDCLFPWERDVNKKKKDSKE